MQILNIRKFEPFERDSKRSNANSKHSKGIRSIQMQIQNIWKGFEPFECTSEPFESTFEPFERDSKLYFTLLVM